MTEVYPEIRFQTEIQFEGKPFATMAAGIPQSAKADGSFDSMKGTFFTGANADEAILQVELAKDLSKQPDTLIGKEVVLRYAERQMIPAEPAAGDAGKSGDTADGDEGMSTGFSMIPREKRLRIIGIVETEPAAGFGGMGRGRLLIPLQTAQTLRVAQPTDMRAMLRGANGKTIYDSLTVRVKSPKDVKPVEDAVKAMGFGAFSIIDATKNVQLFFTVFDLLLGIFGSLALTVASLGIINTLVMAILERRREIGILKALGAEDRDVQRLFFAEAGVMGLAGGVFGVVLGWLIGKALTLGTNYYLHKQQLPAVDLSSVPWWMAVAAIVFSVLVSLLAGIYPASRAAKLNPVEALRYE